MKEKFYLFKMGSSSGGGKPEMVMLSPMFGTPENLAHCGDSFWILKDLFESLMKGEVIIPPDGSLERITVEEGVTCPRRMTDYGPWKKEEGLDYWYKQGPDRKCSFCGSIHPGDMAALLYNDDVTFSLSDKGYKVYIRRPGIINAGFGAIKWYIWHGDETLIKAINERLSKDRAG